MTTRESLIARLAAHRQQHVLAFWDALDAAGRARLAAQIESIDLDTIDRLYRNGPDHEDFGPLMARAEPPPAVRLADAERSEGALRAGAAALSAGRVGALLVAGGQGSRLGFPHPKGMYPIGPVSDRTLFQIHFEKVLAIRARYGQPVPIYLMTSPSTHAETVAFLDRHRRFGLPEDELILFCQGTMPAVDARTGRLLLKDRDQLFLSPDGHGGIVSALEASGALDHMRGRGIEQLFYFQVDNPLVPVCDPTLIGHHLLANSELSTVVVAKTSPHDRVGNAVLVDGVVRIVEYIDLPDAAARAREPDGALKFWAGSVAIHVFARSLLERAAGNHQLLPLHVSKKKVPYLDDSGRRIEPADPNALKFERFVFDLLPAAENAIVIEAQRRQIFAPLKNASGAATDTPEWVRAQMRRQYHEWLTAAGVAVDADAAIEISPWTALSAEELQEKIERGQWCVGSGTELP